MLGLHIVTVFLYRYRYRYCILILIWIRSKSRHPHNNIAQRGHSRLKRKDLRSGAPHTTYYYCLRSNHVQWLQQWRPPRSGLGRVYMQNCLILLEYTCMLRLVGRYFAISLLLFSLIVTVDIDWGIVSFWYPGPVSCSTGPWIVSRTGMQP